MCILIVKFLNYKLSYIDPVKSYTSRKEDHVEVQLGLDTATACGICKYSMATTARSRAAYIYTNSSLWRMYVRMLGSSHPRRRSMFAKKVARDRYIFGTSPNCRGPRPTMSAGGKKPAGGTSIRCANPRAIMSWFPVDAIQSNADVSMSASSSCSA